tara:strand:- start:300 stop:470 length:171 start_codon:yes stop_codon:yes gene_type:complete
MITENELKNQIAITKSLLADDNTPMTEDEWINTAGYLQGLEYVSGAIPPKFNKEDL